MQEIPVVAVSETPSRLGLNVCAFCYNESS